jgi:hypothetical protein
VLPGISGIALAARIGERLEHRRQRFRSLERGAVQHAQGERQANSHRRRGSKRRPQQTHVGEHVAEAGRERHLFFRPHTNQNAGLHMADRLCFLTVAAGRE